MYSFTIYKWYVQEKNALASNEACNTLVKILYDPL